MLVAALVLGGSAKAPQNGNPPIDPQKIVRDASWNELHSKSPGRSFRYRQHKVDPKGTTVKEIFETKDGDVARLIEKDGKPLPLQEAQAETDRLKNLSRIPRCRNIAQEGTGRQRPWRRDGKNAAGRLSLHLRRHGGGS